MNFQLTEEQRMLKEMVHKFADQRIAGMLKEWDEKGAF